MSKTYVYIVGDDVNAVNSLKTSVTRDDVNVISYDYNQWRSGLESPQFRSNLVNGIPSLVFGSHSGSNNSEFSNVVNFPSNPPVASPNVATINELESKAIENAIIQYKGNLTEAAKALGIGRATLYRKVKQYQIDPSMARRKKAA